MGEMMVGQTETEVKKGFGGGTQGRIVGGNHKKFSYISPEEFEMWLHRSEPGDVAVYHIGNLVRASEMRAQLSDLKRRIWDLSDWGVLFLTQRRVGHDNFEYLATRGKRSSAFPKRVPRTKRRNNAIWSNEIQERIAAGAERGRTH